jgi:hypothetical protein
MLEGPTAQWRGQHYETAWMIKNAKDKLTIGSKKSGNWAFEK